MKKKGLLFWVASELGGLDNKINEAEWFDTKIDICTYRRCVIKGFFMSIILAVSMAALAIASFGAGYILMLSYLCTIDYLIRFGFHMTEFARNDGMMIMHMIFTMASVVVGSVAGLINLRSWYMRNYYVKPEPKESNIIKEMYNSLKEKYCLEVEFEDDDANQS